MGEKTMKAYPMTRIKCNECELEMIIVFIEFGGELGDPLYCPNCATKTVEVEL